MKGLNRPMHNFIAAEFKIRVKINKACDLCYSPIKNTIIIYEFVR